MRKVSRKGLIKKLDQIFSLYIRLRYASNEMSECYTCGKVDHYKKLQCGHFMSRRHYATRWDEDNCQVQCYSCNVMRYGEQYKFGLRLAKEKELDLPEKLLAKTRKITKFSDVDIKEMIDLYKEKVRVL
jgi:5-methylcytosine-specific restriction endonuclease McrA